MAQQGSLGAGSLFDEEEPIFRSRPTMDGDEQTNVALMMLESMTRQTTTYPMTREWQNPATGERAYHTHTVAVNETPASRRAASNMRTEDAAEAPRYIATEARQPPRAHNTPIYEGVNAAQAGRMHSTPQPIIAVVDPVSDVETNLARKLESVALQTISYRATRELQNLATGERAYRTVLVKNKIPAKRLVDSNMRTDDAAMASQFAARPPSDEYNTPIYEEMLVNVTEANRMHDTMEPIIAVVYPLPDVETNVAPMRTAEVAADEVAFTETVFNPADVVALVPYSRDNEEIAVHSAMLRFSELVTPLD